MANISSIEVLHLMTVILFATLLVNFCIHLILRYLSTPKSSNNLQRSFRFSSFSTTLRLSWVGEKPTLSSVGNNIGFSHASPASIPSRQSMTQPIEKSEPKGFRSILEEILIFANEQNPRSTYLGFLGSDHNLALFSRCRINGVTKCLGEIARILDNTLILTLHPDDSSLLTQKGWAVAPSRSNPPLSRASTCLNTYGRTVTLATPRNQQEIDSITKSAIDAAVSWSLRYKAESEC